MAYTYDEIYPRFETLAEARAFLRGMGIPTSEIRDDWIYTRDDGLYGVTTADATLHADRRLVRYRGPAGYINPLLNGDHQVVGSRIQNNFP